MVEYEKFNGGYEGVDHFLRSFVPETAESSNGDYRVKVPVLPVLIDVPESGNPGIQVRMTDLVGYIERLQSAPTPDGPALLDTSKPVMCREFGQRELREILYGNNGDFLKTVSEEISNRIFENTCTFILSSMGIYKAYPTGGSSLDPQSKRIIQLPMIATITNFVGQSEHFRPELTDGYAKNTGSPSKGLKWLPADLAAGHLRSRLNQNGAASIPKLIGTRSNLSARQNMTYDLLGMVERYALLRSENAHSISVV